MIPVDSHWEKNALTGFVSRPTATRGTRANQLFFVNGRHIRSKTLTAALEEAYRNRMMVGRFPSCVLHLLVPEHLVDVNVHPAKTEVKFLNEREIFDCVRYGVQGALDGDAGRVEMKLDSRSGGTHTAPKQDFFRTMNAEEYKVFAQAVQDMPRIQPGAAAMDALKSPNRFASASTAPLREATKPAERSKPSPTDINEFSVSDKSAGSDPAAQNSTPTGAAGLPQSFVGNGPDRSAAGTPAVPDSAPIEQTELPLTAQDWRMVGEAFDTYILVEQGEDLLLIDKHAAHERILFEKLRASREPILPQLLLQPIVCTPEREETAILLENAPLLAEFGYEFTDFGGGSLALRQIPAELDPSEAAASLTALAGELLAGRHLAPEGLRDNLLHTVACKAAIKGSRHTDEKEKLALVQEVLSRDDIRYCPHGRPVCIRLTRAQLERQFKRA